MARFVFKGLEEYALKISKLSAGAEEVAGKTLYAGAKVLTDKIRENIEALPTRPEYMLGSAEKPVKGVTPTQKKGLLESLGIAKVQDKDGFYNVKIGFDGYNDTQTKKYHNGQPNQLVARSAESGSTWQEKTPFVRPAITATKDKAVDAMKRAADQEIKKRMK